MKINEILLEAPKKKATKKKVAKKKSNKDQYKPEILADLDLQEAAIAAAKKVATAMKEKCQPWLKASKQGSLIVYRGISDRSGLAFTKKTREDRRPKDTSQSRHQAFNAAIAAVGGVANRSNALFCSASINTASDYGHEYVLIPIGEFNYTWSPRWYDWTNNANPKQLKELLKTNPEDGKKLAEQIKKLKAMFPAYKEKKLASIRAAFKKEAAGIPAKIKAKENKLKNMKYKSGWVAENLKYDIKGLKIRLRELTNPKDFESIVNRRFKYSSEYDANNPMYKIQKLKQNQGSNYGYEVSKDMLDPTNYDVAKTKAAILVDKDLERAVKSKKEIMISCQAGLYIKPKFYKNFVLPTLQGKKITAKYEIESSNYDDNW